VEDLTPDVIAFGEKANKDVIEVKGGEKDGTLI
jgi:hypothetical protein